MAERLTAASLGLAFLGCGGIAARHSRTLAALPGLGIRRLYASRDAEKGRVYAERFGGEYVGCYASAIEDRRVDAVLIATPPARHLELTMEALRVGKNVIVEKPAYAAVSDFDAVRLSAAAAGRRVMVAENYFYKPLARKLRQLVEQRAIGDVLLVAVNALKAQHAHGWRGDLAAGEGLLEGGIHWVNLMANLGPTIERATAERFGDPADHGFLCSFRYCGGAAGSLAFSWGVPSPLRGARLSRIYGSRGSIAFESNGALVAVWGGRPHLAVPDPRDAAGFRAMFADFVRSLRTDEEPLFTLDLARRDAELVAALRASAGGLPPDA